MKKCTLCLAVVVTFVSVSVAKSYAADPATIRLEQKKGEWVRLVEGEHLIWQFNYAGSLNKPFFHPLALPGGGPVITWNEPPDHRWHHALWFSWKLINGVNYWENDRQTGRPAGRTQWSDVVVEPLENQAVRIRMQLTYQPPGNPPVLQEQRVVRVGAPDAKNTYSLDWESTWVALADQVVLDRTPLPHEPGGRAYGGYAGLSVRFAQGLADRQAVGTDGDIDFAASRYRGKHAAIDYQGRLGDQTFGVAIFNHPENPRTPSPWYLIQGNPMSYANAAFLCYEAFTLSKDEELTLRYRLLVHPERWNKAQLDEAQKDYLEQE